MKLATLLLTVLFSSSAFAGFTKLAECVGNTEHGNFARVLVFVDDANDNRGYLSASVENEWDYLSATQINWHTGTGYPQVQVNDFDLDVMISDQKSTVDDAILGDSYVAQLECFYTPMAGE